ncbi:hypothetical protein [Qipengyuania nanhaisediminis]|uniref:hypothetical protein n=1 Tax=Qipengyuania nanhaisediminis TaxID=604088 RepID=UPI0038B31917
MRARLLVIATLAPLALTGCIVKTAADIVTAPVRVGAKAVDLATTSQSEADEARGREIRRREEKLARLERQYLREAENCADGDRGACRDAEEIREEIEELLPTVPVERDDR